MVDIIMLSSGRHLLISGMFLASAISRLFRSCTHLNMLMNFVEGYLINVEVFQFHLRQ